MNPLTGVIHGKTIELEQSPGLAEGAHVEIIIRIIPEQRSSMNDLQKAAEAFAKNWTPEDDKILAEIQNARMMSEYRDDLE